MDNKNDGQGGEGDCCYEVGIPERFLKSRECTVMTGVNCPSPRPSRKGPTNLNPGYLKPTREDFVDFGIRFSEFSTVIGTKEKVFF